MNAQARLGAFVIIALLVLALLSSRIGHFEWIKPEGIIIETILEDAAGIAVQSPILMAGVKVGQISNIDLKENQALVYMRILPGIQLPASTRAHIAGGGLVGEKYIALRATPGDTDPLTDNRIPAEQQAGIESLMNSASSITEELQIVTHKANHIADMVTAMMEDNRSDIRKTTQNFGQASQQLSSLLKKRHRDLNQLLKTLPDAAQAGEDFFSESTKAMHDFRELIVDNRENLYRTLFELRKASENLESLSDDLRRNPWKLLKEKPEVKASHRAKQAKIEEMLLTTGQSGK